jgi:peptidyl-dipeptidase Dcp
MNQNNPLLEEWTTPFGLPPFDRIRPEHFTLAFEQAMTAHLGEIAAIAENPSPPDFTNTIAAMERAGSGLKRVAAVFYNLVGSLGGAPLERLDMTLSPILARHRMQVMLNPKLFDRVATLFSEIDFLVLDSDQSRLLRRVHLNLVRGGAALAPAAKARMAEISERLAVLHTRFGQNVLHDEREWRLDLLARPRWNAPPRGTPPRMPSPCRAR